MAIIPTDNPEGGVAPFVYVPRCEGEEPFLSPSIPDIPLAEMEDRGTWDLRLAIPSTAHWSLLEDEAFQQHISRLEALRLEEAQKAEEPPESKSTKKKGKAKAPSPGAGTTKHPPTVKRSKSALKKLLEEGQVGEPTGDEDLLLDTMAASLLDKPASDKIMEEASELLERVRSLQLQAMYEMGSARMIDRTLAEGFSARVCAHQFSGQ